MRTSRLTFTFCCLLLALIAAACGSTETSDTVDTATEAQPAATDDTDAVTEPVATTAPLATTAPAQDDSATEPTEQEQDDENVGAASPEPTDAAPIATSTFTADVWADNWFAMHVNGVLVAEDSVPITTERSFNKETFSFEASYPLVIAVEAKDFKETDSGIEYIGARNQQMGDGGIIIQVRDDATGEVVAVSNGDWSMFPVHQAPLNKECETDPDPDATCLVEINEAPTGWTSSEFDSASWASASVWTENDVQPKDGYDQVTWDAAAELIWGSDLEIDNTILLRSPTIGS